MQKAMQHARRARYTHLPISTAIRRRVKGKHVSPTESYRDHQLSSPGEEKAIIDHCEIMGRLGFQFQNRC